MNAPFQQDTRMGRLVTVLGKDVLNLLRFDGQEMVNGLFSYRIEALATRDDLALESLIGTHATVVLRNFDLPETLFDGIVTEAELQGMDQHGWCYILTLQPWAYLMSLRRKQQIFHDKTVVEILDEVFLPWAGLGQPAVEKRLTKPYPVLEYTVQYRESDLAFATRLMERFGISYHFSHAEGSHTLVLTDAASEHRPLPGDSRKVQVVAEDHRAGVEHFWEMRPARRLTTGKIRLTDYNFKTPDAAMEAERDGAAGYAEGHIESYDYPGDYLDQGAGQGVARLRADQERGQDQRHRAAGDCVSLRAGLLVTVTGAAPAGVGKSLCLVAQHRYISAGYGSTSSGEPVSEGQFLLMPAEAPLAPERKTRPPVVQGPQTARVVGEGEIDCDEFGRILVRFHWDLDDRFSMRCRVSQNWAGKGWGGMVIPRIGMEVVVEFLEGDPDKPLVTGCVYNGKNEVPYKLPEHKTRSTFKTDTHQGTGFNEIRFEDKAGKEEVFVHAQKDMNTGINNNASQQVGANDHSQIGRNSTRIVGGLQADYAGLGRMIGSGGSVTIESGRASTLAAVAGAFYKTGGTIGYPFAAMIRDAESHSAMRPGSITMSAGADIALQGGGELTMGSNQSMSLSAQESVSIVAGDDYRVTSAQSIVQHSAGNTVIASEGAIILRSGAAEIVLRPNGDIAISGAKITLKGDSIWLN